MATSTTSVDDDVRDIKGLLARLEPVISRIDERVKNLDERVRAVEIEMAEIKGRISQLPTTIQVIGFALVVLAAGGFLRYFGH